MPQARQAASSSSSVLDNRGVNTRPRRALLAILPAVIGLSLIGCGDGGPRLSRSQFTARANSICMAAQRDLARLPTPHSLRQVGAVGDRIVPLLAQRTKQLERLRPPEGLQKDWNAYVHLDRERVDLDAELRDAAKHNAAFLAIRARDRGREIAARRARVARLLGLRNCARRD
jgi:hypothetical protein